MFKVLRHIFSMTLLYSGAAVLLVAIVPSDKSAPPLTPTQVAAYTQPTVIPKAQSTAKSVTAGYPSRLVIESLGIDIPVLEGEYSTQTHTWNITEANAHFAQPSVIPNDHTGNTFIYGHKNPIVFEQLHKMQPGQTAQVYTKEGPVFTYKLVSSEVLQPEDTTIFTYKGDPMLTLQTCTGDWNQLRALYHLELTEVKNA